MNRTPLARRAQIINCLVEGNSIRSTERMTQTHRDTIMRLLVEVGDGCAKIMDERMRDLQCRRIQVDELWCYVAKKQRNMRPFDDRLRVGDQWTFVALDPESKLVPCYHIGKRTKPHAITFIDDLSKRLANRVQLSSDALHSYVDAVEKAFAGDVDYGQEIKFYEADVDRAGRYSPPHVIKRVQERINGFPDPAHISTSLIERQNLTVRMSMRRFTRLTNGFSKKIENLRAAVSLHFCHYNFVRLHKTIRMTPAMAAGIESRLWSIEELVERTSK